jgi:hypothetical protein
MKKALSVLAVASLAAVVCVPFAACGENADNFKSQEVDKETFAAATSMGKSKVTLEAYYSAGETQSETTVYYKDEAGAWQTTTANMSYGFSMYQPSELLSDYLFEADDYEAFVFDAEKKGYYYEEDGESVLIKFKDGKLYSLKTVE